MTWNDGFWGKYVIKSLPIILKGYVLQQSLEREGEEKKKRKKNWVDFYCIVRRENIHAKTEVYKDL